MIDLSTPKCRCRCSRPPKHRTVSGPYTYHYWCDFSYQQQLSNGAFFKCSRCNQIGTYQFNLNAAYNEDEEEENSAEIVCGDCYDKYALIKQFNYKGFYNRPHLGKDKIKYGIELEVFCRGKHHKIAAAQVHPLVKDFAVLKWDGSIDGRNGFEIVSVPCDFSLHEKLWTQFFIHHDDALDSFNTKSCGMHVHISRQGLSSLQIAKMMVFITNPYNDLFIRKIAGRKSNDFCEKIAKNINTNILCNGHRHEALHATTGNTVEIRIFKGTLYFPAFLKNLEFCHALVQYTDSYINPKSITDKSLFNFENYIDFVFKHAKLYPHLHRFMVNGFSFKEMSLADIIKVNTKLYGYRSKSLKPLKRKTYKLAPF